MEMIRIYWTDLAAWTIAIATVVVLITQIVRERRVRRAEMLLTLRREFSYPKRAAVHTALRFRDWDDGVPMCRWPDIEDYLGILEICAYLIRDRVITLRVFADLYEYRVHNLLCNEEIVQRKLCDEKGSWTSFTWLVDVLLKNGYLKEYQGDPQVMRILESAPKEFDG